MTTISVDTPAAVTWTIGQIAERDGISKQAVSKKVKALAEAHGLAVSRDGRGRIVAVNVAAYDHLREQFGDPSKAQAQNSAAPAHPAKSLPTAEAKSLNSFEEARRQQAWIDAERSRMRFAAEKGELISVGGVADAIDNCAVEISRLIDRLSGTADEIAAAVGRDGSHGVRVALKAIATKLRNDIATALAGIASTAPELEQEIPRQPDEEENLVAADE